MAVSNDFSSSELDLNGMVNIGGPTALVWGPDGRLYVTEVSGDVNILSVAFGDKDPNDSEDTAQFYVTESETLTDVKNIQNYNDDGTLASQQTRQVTGIDVTKQYDENGEQVFLADGKPAVVIYVTSSDSRIGAGGSGADEGLDTNSGVITRMVEQSDGSFVTVDLVRGLARSEENHATNGLEVIQELDTDGNLVSERIIVASGGNANTGAPSNNFAGQQETPTSAAILEVDLDQLNDMTVSFDPDGRAFIYDLPTLDDPTREGAAENDPHGGNDGLNSAILTADSPVQIYAAGFRNAFDVEVTEDGRVFTYDNGANNNWGGRPAGEDEDGDTDSQEAENGTPDGYIATNLFVEDNNEIAGNFNPQNWDSLHEVTRSDDLGLRELSAGQGGAQTYSWDHPDFAEPLELVYGGHPNPTRAEGARAGILYSPEDGTQDAKLMVSNVGKDDGNGGTTSDFLEVVAWLSSIGYTDAFINQTVVALDPGVRYNDTFAAGFGGAGANGRPTVPDVFSLTVDEDGPIGLPANIDAVVTALNPIEGNYLEAGYTDGSVDTSKGSVNGLAEYTSTILDDEAAGIKMSGALWASTFNGTYLLIGRGEDGTVGTATANGRTVAADKTTIQADGGPLGLSAIGDDLTPFGGEQAFQGTVWAAIYKENGPVIEIFQPGNPDTNPLLPVYAGQVPSDPTDNDLDGVDHLNDPFDYSADNGFALSVGEALVLDFQLNPPNPDFAASLGDTGLLGAALDGNTPNRDALTADDGFTNADDFESGLFDNGGNLIIGANAPKTQIKVVKDGTAVGTANDMLDGLQTGVRIDDDVKRLVADIEISNWTADQAAADGRKTGLMFGDGTQSNFVRVFFGDTGSGLGVQVGVETENSYTILGTATDPAFVTALTAFTTNEEKIALGQKTVQLQLEIADIGDSYTIIARYAIKGETDFTAVTLSNSTLPEGVLRAVLDGSHQISDGDTTATSGAGIGLFAEKDDGISFTAVDINEIRVTAFGNEIIASDAAGVAATGTAGTDTIVYDGTDTNLAPLNDTVENFDGTASDADYDVTGNDNDNTIIVGSGQNEITTGEGSDVIKGTLDDLDGDTFTDFSSDDAVVIQGFSTDDLTEVEFFDGSAVVEINGRALTFDGPDFENFEAIDGPASFTFTDTTEGLRITSREPLTPVVAINAGGLGTITGTVRETTLNFIGDEGGTVEGPGFTTTGANKAYTNGAAQGTDFPDTDLDAILASERSNGSAFGYEVPVPNGTYLVDLIFAEIYFGLPGTGGASAGAGSRVFDGEIEGQQVFDNLDIFAEAGGAGQQLIKSYEVEVTDGSLSINIPAVGGAGEVNQGKLAGVVVWDVGGGFVPVDVTAPVIEEITLENLQNVTDQPLELTVVVTDETGFDTDNFTAPSGADINFDGYTPASVSDATVEFSNGGQTATLTYIVTAVGNAWTNGTVGTISLDAGAFSDAAGNSSEAASGGFVVQSELASLIRGGVVKAVNLGTTDQTDGNLGVDMEEGGVDNNRYGGALTDTIITDAFGNPVVFEADDEAYHTAIKANQNPNVDGQSGTTGSNSGGVDLDGSAYHTYRDSNAAEWSSTYTGFANGTYIVELHFAELFHTSANSRVGDFTVNGRLIDAADNYDAFAEGGGADKPSSFMVPVTVTDGTITVEVSTTEGQAGYSAIVVYEAVDSSLPPAISVQDTTVAEDGTAEVVFTRTGDLSEAVTIEFTVTAGTADVSDFSGVPVGPVVIQAGQSSASISFVINDDDDVEGAETINVTIDTATIEGGNDAVIADGDAIVTIAASDAPFEAPVGATIFELDFDGVTGEATVVGGFDGTLGDEALTEDQTTSEVADGKLQVQTAEGDINDGADNGSINDFTRIADVSDANLVEVYLTSRFDNPFTEAELTAQGITDGRLPNFVQQGIVLGDGTQAAGKMVKLVWGAVAAGTAAPSALGVQMWTKGTGALNGQATLAQMAPGVDQFDVASIEMSLLVNKVDGTAAMYVTLFDDAGLVLGGVRPEPTAGFFALAPLPVSQLVIDNMKSATEPTHFGVTSSDNSDAVAFGSFTATWDYLNLSSPQFVDGPPADSVNGVAVADGDFSDNRLAPTDIGTLVEGETEIVATQQGDNEPGGRERDYFTFTVAEGQELTGIILEGLETEESGFPQAFIGINDSGTIPFDPDAETGADQMLGGYVYGSGDVNNGTSSDGNLLPGLGAGNTFGIEFRDDDGDGFGDGFTGPLPAGTYTLWLNQGGSASTATIKLVTAEAVIADLELSIADASEVVEGGDAGTSTTVAFTVTADDTDFNGDVTVTYDAGSDTGLTQVVTFVNGVGTLSVDVANDDVDTGDTTVDVTLTGATGAGATFSISAGAPTASGTIADDDTVFARGDVLYAVNAGGPALTQDGIDFIAGLTTSLDSPWTGGVNFTDSNGGNGQQPIFDGTVYETEINGDSDGDFDAAVTFPGINPNGQYFIDLYFAEIFASDVGGRVIDISIEGQAPAADSLLFNLDVLALNGGTSEAPLINAPLLVEVPDAVSPGANGTIDLSFVGVEDRAKISAIVIREAVPVDPFAVDVSVADVAVSEDDGIATVTFTREGNTFTDMEITYSTSDGTAVDGEDYTGATTQTVTILAGETTATVDIALTDDEVTEATEAFTVTIEGAEATDAVITIADADATVTINDDDIPVGPAPDEDLDGDGIINSEDPDVDGDGALNGEETFSYDGTNVGTALINGDEVTFDFDVDGTPFENGFTGALLSPNNPNAEEVNLDNVNVSNGTLNVNVQAGDHFSNGNTNENAMVAAFRADEGLSVETRFAIPDYDNTTDGVQTGANFQSTGVVIGVDQNNLVKAVFGRAGTFEIAHDNANNNGTGKGVTVNALPADAVEVSIRLELTFNLLIASPPVAQAYYTFYDVNGDVIGVAETPFPATDAPAFTILDNATGNSGFRSVIESGAALGAGVIHTSTGGGSPDSFDVSYEYLTVKALGTPPIRVSVTDDVTIEENGDTGTTALAFELTLIEASADETLTIDYTLNGEAGSATVNFINGVGTLEIEIDNDDAANGTESFDLELTGASDGAILGATTTATGTVTEDDAAPTVGTPIAAQGIDQGAALDFDVPAAAFADADTTDLALTATLADGGALPTWLSFVDGNFTGTPENGDVGDITVRVTADDGTNPTVFADFTLTVNNVNDAPTIDAIDAGTVTEFGEAVTIDLLDGAADIDVDDVVSLDPLSVVVTDADDAAVPAEAFSLVGSEITIDPAFFAEALNDGDTETLTVTYNVIDENGGTTLNTATLEITGRDPAQIVALGEDPTIVEAGDDGDTTVVFALTLSDQEAPETRDITYTVDGGDEVTVTVAFTEGAGSLSVDVANDVLANGTESITLALTNVSGENTVLGTKVGATGTVTEDDFAPVVDAGIAELPVDEDAALNFTIPADAFADADTDALTLSATLTDGGDLPAWLSFDEVVSEVDASVSYVLSGTPLNGDVGTISVRVTASDGENTDAFVDFNVVVANTNDEPEVTVIAADPVRETDPDVEIDLLMGATDVDVDDTLSVADVVVSYGDDVVIEPENYTLVGSVLTISPSLLTDVLDDGESATVTISFNVTDGLASVPNTASFVVNGRAAPRDWYLDADLDGFGDANTVLNAIDQPDGYVDNALDADDLDDTIYPDAPEINDGKDNNQNGETDELNNAPIVIAEDLLIERNTSFGLSAAELLSNDSDPDGDELSITAVNNAQNGTVTFENGQVVFTPDIGFTGAASFDYEVSDNFGGSTTTTVNVTVTDPDNVTSILIDSPVLSYAGQDWIAGRGSEVSDDLSALTLTGDVWKKIAFLDDYDLTTNTVLRFDLTLLAGGAEVIGIGFDNDDDFRNDDQALFQLGGTQDFTSEASQVANGMLGPIGSTTTYEINLAGLAGRDFSHLVFINDQDDLRATTKVTFSNITLVEVDPNAGGTQAPFIFNGALADQVLAEDVPFQVDLPFLDNDTAFEDLSFEFTGLPDFITEVNGTLVGTGGNDDVGTYTIGVTARDPEGNAVTDTFDLTIENVNDDPMAVGTVEAQTGILDEAFALPLAADLFVDVDAGDTLSYRAEGLPDGVEIDPDTGEITGTPTESGDFAITLFAKDTSDAEASVTFAFEVLDGPPPVPVTIAAEDFTGLTGTGSDLQNFFVSFAAPADGNEVLRVETGETGVVSTDLDSAGLIPGLYEITVTYMDELGGASTVAVALDLGDGSPLQPVGSFAMDRTDLPGQGVGALAGNLTAATLPAIDIPAGARLVITGIADGTEQVRIDTVDFTPVINAEPVFDSPVAFTASENAVEAATVSATDGDGQALTYAIAGTGADDAAFVIDPDSGALSFVQAPDFEVPADDDGDGVYQVTVTATDGRDVTEQMISITVGDANDAPVPTAEVINRTIGLNQTAALPALAAFFADQDPSDIVAITASGLPAGLSVVDGAIVGSATESGSFTVTLTASDGTADPVEASFELTVEIDFGAVSPDEDLDGDEVLNADDPDVDGDGILNEDDLFSYDAENGMTLVAGETRTYDFDIEGNIFENGMTGFLQATANGGDFDEDTGATSVAGGLLTVDPVTGGDTGTLNTPEDDAVVGVKNGTFTAKAVILNPWVSETPNPGGFDQVGLVLGLDSADMIKLVFGQTAGVVEFQKQDADVGTKFGGTGPNANVPFPAGVTLDNFAQAEITFEVTSTDPTSASVTGTIVFQADDGSVIATMNLGAAPIGGALAAALNDADTGVAVGFTHADAAAAPGFVAQMDSLEISVAGDGSTGGGDDVVVYRINSGGELVAATDGGPNWVADGIGSPISFLTAGDDRGDAFGYSGDAGAIPATVPTAVLNTARSSDGVFSYDVPTSELGGGENYEVRLYVAELFSGGQVGGFRNFDATLEGFVPAAFNNIDPGNLFGADVGVLTAQVKVTDGVLNIGFAQDIIQNPIINAIEIVALSTDVENPGLPVDPASALEAFAAQDDLDTDAIYADEVVGSAILEVMAGNNNIQSSNFTPNSFQVTNTGDKKIAAVFIDVTSALYQDSVFDPDGQGGDTAVKDWAINSDGGTGAFVTGTGYFLPGIDPIPNSGGSGGPSNGGFKGAMVKFDVNDDGGFENGETVGFSGDMDPNSVAGMGKSAIDGSAILSWDVGGISGHEIIGSLFTVLFDDGTTASGQLASDGSSAGSHAVADQGVPVTAAPGLAVNGTSPGGTGTYGVTLPTITVTGEPGDKVQITMTKGFNPVVETDNGIADLVEDRLERYDFKANNAFDVQTVVVTIGEDGTFDASTLFDYDDAVNNDVGSGSFAGDDVAQIGFVATKVEGGQGSLPISATTAPIYLTNEGGTVPGDPSGGTGGIDGYFAINGSGSNNAFFKIQIEDENGTGGTNPGGKWSYETAPDAEGRQAGFQGDGYYLFGSNTSTGIDNNVGGNELLEYTIFVSEDDLGVYDFSFVVSRDVLEGVEGDQQNDLWLNFKHAEDAGNGDIEEFLTGNGANEAEPTAGGFIKLFGGPQNNNWGNAGGIDGLPGNFGASIEIVEEGLYTIQVDGRSQGYHIDYFELYKGGNPGAGSGNSAWIEGEPGSGGGGGPVDGELVVAIDAAADDWEERGGAVSADVELGDNGGPQFVGLRFDDIDIPDGAVLEEAFIRFTAQESNADAAIFAIQIENDETAAGYTAASDPGSRDYTADEFIWTAEPWVDGQQYQTVDISDMISNLIGPDGVDDGAFGFLITPENDGASRVADAFGSGGTPAELVLIFDEDSLI